MPELIEQMYCSQQIVIPPKYPYILKRYCKAAIKTQPYDLLRWSFEYFKALSQHRPPPVKLRLEYPVFSTEGGLTRGCLKVLANQDPAPESNWTGWHQSPPVKLWLEYPVFNTEGGLTRGCYKVLAGNQLAGMSEVPLPVLKKAWGGFCLDQVELKRMLCLCEVYAREETVQFLKFIAVAGGLLTKSLTHTMILLCESLTKEPDGGSAAIPVQDFLVMYKFLARIDASKNVRYFDGYREGETPEPESIIEEEEIVEDNDEPSETSSDDFWEDTKHLQKLSLINDRVATTTRLSDRLTLPTLGKIERSPSIERAGQIERENYLRERKGRAAPSDDIDRRLRAMSTMLMSNMDMGKEGEPIPVEEKLDEEDEAAPMDDLLGLEESKPKQEEAVDPRVKIAEYVAEIYAVKQERLEDLEQSFDEIAAIVDRFKSANYDLGMVAGRQMSTTSGEFIVQHIEREIMDYIDEQIAILPDPDLKKKKAKPEEVEMIRQLLETFLDENMDIIVPEIEEVEEEELPIPEITVVYAVPGIGPSVDEDIIHEFQEYALDVCKVQADLFMPRNIRHFMCPPLEKYEEHKYEPVPVLRPSKEVVEQVHTGGVITE